MKLTPEMMDRKMEEHFNFERTDNVEGVLSTLAPDATHDIVGTPSGPTYGRDNARPFYEHLFTDLTDGKVKTIRKLYGSNFIVDESLWEGRAPGQPFGLNGKDRPLAFRLLHVVEFTEAGQIQKEQVWIDLAAILKQLPQNP
jgi:hypothetical protein